MLLTDYFRYPHDATWDYALQSGVTHGVIRLPETTDFDVTNAAHIKTVCDDFKAYGITPVIVEPMPNALHDHIKAGDEKRDEALEKVCRMLPLLAENGIRCICFNFMAHIGWLRTSSDAPERGGARVTMYRESDFVPTDARITAKELWDNYAYFLDAVLPTAEKCGIRLALHPDDPPVARLGNVERIMISRENIRKAIYDVRPSEALGLTMCQANFYIMGEDVAAVIGEFADRIFFIHFRNTVGDRACFRETFHDNGALDMAALMKTYRKHGVDVPIRVDHVPTYAGEDSKNAGYDAIGRLFAIGYLKGILDGLSAAERNG